jgi:hypothetical protein
MCEIITPFPGMKILQAVSKIHPAPNDDAGLSVDAAYIFETACI